MNAVERRDTPDGGFSLWQAGVPLAHIYATAPADLAAAIESGLALQAVLALSTGGPLHLHSSNGYYSADIDISGDWYKGEPSTVLAETFRSLAEKLANQ